MLCSSKCYYFNFSTFLDFDVARVNAMTVNYINKGLAPSKAKADKSFTEEWELAMTLIKPHMAHRFDNASNLTNYL